MTAVTFDTHKFVRKLKASGFNEQQAEALSDAVQEAQIAADIATKADLREYESAIRYDLEKLETGLRHEIGDLRKDMDAKHESLRKEMKELFLRQIIWLGSIVFLVVNAGPLLPKLLRLG